jgi:hypothetical protein
MPFHVVYAHNGVKVGNEKDELVDGVQEAKNLASSMPQRSLIIQEVTYNKAGEIVSRTNVAEIVNELNVGFKLDWL